MPPENIRSYLYFGGGGGDHRRELFRERRHGSGGEYERPSVSSSSYYVVGGQQQHLPYDGRWRESSSYYGSSAEFGRWGFGEDLRRHHLHPGYEKQGAWHVYTEEPPPYGYTTPRYASRFFNNDGIRPFGPRGDGRGEYARNYKGNTGASSQRERRKSPWKDNHQVRRTSAGASSRQQEVNRLRSAGSCSQREKRKYPWDNREECGAWASASTRQREVDVPRSFDSYSQRERRYSPWQQKHQQQGGRVSASDGQQKVNGLRSIGDCEERERSNPPWEENQQHNESAGASPRQQEVNDLGSVGDVVMHDPPHTDSSCAADELHIKHPINEQTDRNGPGVGQKFDHEISASGDWKPLKWSRTRSLPAPNLDFSTRVSPGSVIGEPSNARNGLLDQNAIPVELPPVDPFASVASTASPAEKVSSREKPCQGWGEGLARFEKKKVEGPDDNVDKSAEMLFTPKLEISKSVTSSLADKSPELEGELPDCSSAMTPLSLASSAVPEELHHKHLANEQSDGSRSGVGQKDIEISASSDWKPLKWSRTGSLSASSLGFGHSVASGSVPGEPSDMKNGLSDQNATLVELPYVYPFTSATSTASPAEEVSLRKKPRLGWGEGLAKFEKKKFEGPDDNADKIAETLCSPKPEVSESVTSSLADGSPELVGLADCSSPMTPLSLASSALPGAEDNMLIKVADDVNDATDLSALPVSRPDIQNDVSSVCLEDVEPGLMTYLSTMIAGLLQGKDQNSLDSGSGRTSAQDRLMLWKRAIGKALVCTEFEIDVLQNELVSLRSEPGRERLCLVSTGSSMDCMEQMQKPMGVILGTASEEVMPSGENAADMMASCENAIEVAHPENDGMKLDSPGTVTSKFVEPPFLVNSESSDEHKRMSFGEIIGVKSPKRECDPSVKMLAGPLVSSSEMVHEGGISSIGSRSPTAGENDGWKNILASNKVTAAKASELFLKLLPTSDYSLKDVNLTRVSCAKIKLLIKNKLFLRKQSLKFKEKVLYLKHRALQHSWKESLRLLPAKEQCAKSQKKSNKCSQILNGGCQKHRSSIGSCVASPGESSRLVPSTNAVAFTSKLLSCSGMKRYRDDLKMPSLILDENEKVISRFISNNGLVEDPCAAEKERALINSWTAEEKEIFIDKLAYCGKDFRKIATFLVHKTAADCIEFYYQNHKSDSFQRIKNAKSKKLEKSLSSNAYLVTSSEKQCRGMNSASSSLLGEASMNAARGDANQEASKAEKLRRFRSKLRVVYGSSSRSRSCGDENKRETAAAAVLAGMSGSLSSEAVNSCITSSADPSEGCHGLKSQIFGASSMRHPQTPEVMRSTDEATCSDESCGEMDPVDWTDDETSLFLQAIATYGKDFLLISRRVQTKSRDQCKVFFSKARKRLGLEAIASGSCNGRTSASNDAYSGGSDSSDAFLVKSGSVVTSDKSGSRMDEDKEQEVISYEPTSLWDERKMAESCDASKPENQDDAVHVALDAVKESARICTASGNEALHVVAEVSGVLGPFPLVASMGKYNIIEEASGVNRCPESADKHRGNQEVPFSDYDMDVYEDYVNNRYPSADLHHPLVGQATLGHYESSNIMRDYLFGLSIKGAPNGNIRQDQYLPVEIGSKPRAKVMYLERCRRNMAQKSVTETKLFSRTSVQSKVSDYPLARLYGEAVQEC